MDLAITENTAFKFVLDMNQYRAIGIAYTSFRDLKFADVKANGVTKEFMQALPFIASDYLNEAGLYIETNMRNGESGFECTGTNPGAEVSLNAVGLPAYLASRCATVDETGNVNLETGSLLNCTSDWVLDDSHADLTYACISSYVSNYFGSYRTESGYDFAAIRADATNHPDFWVSAYSFAVDCSAKTIKAHFWENTDITLEFSFQ